MDRRGAEAPRGRSEFMRSMIGRIAEDVAKERGHMEVNVELFEKVEALGDIPIEKSVSMEWTDEALALLNKRIQDSPPNCHGICDGYVKAGCRGLARSKGIAKIDAETLIRLWEDPPTQVAWTDEAWKRLHTSPDFVQKRYSKSRRTPCEKTRTHHYRLRTPHHLPK